MTLLARRPGDAVQQSAGAARPAWRTVAAGSTLAAVADELGVSAIAAVSAGASGLGAHSAIPARAAVAIEQAAGAAVTAAASRKTRSEAGAGITPYASRTAGSDQQGAPATPSGTTLAADSDEISVTGV
ncbi:hypothetical protein B1T50_10130, partial [Mycobacterium kansasii]